MKLLGLIGVGFIVIGLIFISGCGVEISEVSESPELSYEFSGCDSGARSPDAEKTKKLVEAEVIVKDDMINIKHNLDYVCCADMEIEFEEKEGVIELVEVNKGEMCRCMCVYNVDAFVGPFEKGEYVVKVFGVKYQDIAPELIIEKGVEIR